MTSFPRKQLFATTLTHPIVRGTHCPAAQETPLTTSTPSLLIDSNIGACSYIVQVPPFSNTSHCISVRRIMLIKRDSAVYRLRLSGASSHTLGCVLILLRVAGPYFGFPGVGLPL